MKYALIGCGRIAINHIKAAINNNLDIVAVCDIIPEKMDAILDKSDLQSNTEISKYTDYKDMVKKEKPDLVVSINEPSRSKQVYIPPFSLSQPWFNQKGIMLFVRSFL